MPDCPAVLALLQPWHAAALSILAAHGLAMQGSAVMLVLSRKVGEGIQLGDDITVTLVKISGNMVRLGIQAPPHLPVARQELIMRLTEASHSDNSEREPAGPQATG
jgi:carbon storage regulator